MKKLQIIWLLLIRRELEIFKNPTMHSKHPKLFSYHFSSRRIEKDKKKSRYSVKTHISLKSKIIIENTVRSKNTLKECHQDRSIVKSSTRMRNSHLFFSLSLSLFSSSRSEMNFNWITLSNNEWSNAIRTPRYKSLFFRPDGILSGIYYFAKVASAKVGW